MKTCSLFGDQCFKRNMVFTVAQLQLNDFYRADRRIYWSPSQPRVSYLTERPPWTARRPRSEIEIYYNRSSQIRTAARELRCCLFVFDA